MKQIDASAALYSTSHYTESPTTFKNIDKTMILKIILGGNTVLPETIF